MPLTLLQLDNTYPPIWLQNNSAGKTVGGVAATSVTPYADANSSLKKTEGHDYQNYFVRQRVEGDLFHRDLLIVDLLKSILNYLGQRTGLLFNLPEAYVQDGGSIVLARLGSISPDDGMYITAASCTGGTISVEGNTFGTTSPVWTTGALSNSSRGTRITGPNIVITATKTSGDGVMTGFVALAAKTV